MSRFAEFQVGPRPEGLLYTEDCVRVARVGDLEAIARISAEREGLPVDAIRTAIGKDLAAIGTRASHCTFVAEFTGAVVAYGRVRHLEHERDALPSELPAGWYLNGIVVAPADRRRGLGAALTQARLRWLRDRTPAVHYVSNLANRVSIQMHARLGFQEIARGFDYPRAALASKDSVAFQLSTQPGPSGSQGT